MGILKCQDMLKLHLQHVNNRKIAEIYGCSRTTAISVVLECDKWGLALEQIESKSDEEL